MVERPGLEPWIERVIREAQEDGRLDVTKGVGKPIPGLSRPYDPAWWARNWIVVERAKEQAADLARSVEQQLPRVLARETDDEVRSGLDALNDGIVAHNDANPDLALPLLDVETLIRNRSDRR
jgi:hypothetical protein